MTEATINEVFRNRATKYGNRLAVEKRLRGAWEGATWNQYYERSRAVGLGLHALGVSREDRVSLLSENRLEWLYTDMGTLGIGACLVPIYPTVTPEEVQYILGNSESKVVVVENQAQLEKALPAKESCPSLERIVVLEDQGRGAYPPFVMGFAQLLKRGEEQYVKEPHLFERLAGSVGPQDLATIVYTSGTTGVPKGAMITHKNIMAVVRALDKIRPKYAFDTDQTVPFLPLSHVFERVAGHFYGMYVGITASYSENLETLVEDLQQKRPTLVLAVPRVCEKIYQRILGQVKEQPTWRQRLFQWGVGIGSRISQLREEKETPPMGLLLKYKFAYALIFKKLQKALGGRVRWITASGAPTAEEIIRFFNSAGIMVVEGYGMTECTAPATMSNLGDYKIGTVGRPLPGVGIKIARDGEILIKGDNVFKGYWKMERETQAVFTQDGYLKSGDVGSLDKDGFLRILDRKKDLIITSGGKNIAPQKIENLFKGDPLFSQVIVIGDRRKYLAALLNLDLGQAALMASERSVPYNRPEDLLDSKDFLKVVEDHVSELNKHLARYETIKRYTIVKTEFSKDSGELTATLKVKRKVVQEKYRDLIEAMYQD